MQYGKLVNGTLRKAPHRLTYDGCNSDSHSADVYLKFGYKQIISATPPSECPRGKELVSEWLETETQIIQQWIYRNLPDDFDEIYRREKGRFNLSMLALKNSVQEYVQRKDEEIERLFSDPILVAARKCILNKYPDLTIKGAMAHYDRAIPINFFHEINMYPSLIEMGYTINGNKPVFVTKDGKFIQLTDSDLYDLVDGVAYLKSTREKLYLLSEFNAVMYRKDDEPVIINPLFLAFKLKSIAEIYDSAYGNSMQHNMTYCYLHTIMDEFLTSTLRYYMQTHPEGSGLDRNISARDIVGIKSIEELYALQQECLDQRINGLGHESYKEKMEFLKKRGIECVCDKETWFDDVIWFCEKRNALVHNSGIINQTNISKLKDTCYYTKITVGESVLPTYEELQNAIKLIEKVCNNLYEAMKSKFSL